MHNLEKLSNSNYLKFISKTLPNKNGCIEWQFGKDKNGYGKYSLFSRQIRAHRASWFFKTGSMPPSSLCICHHCDNPSCIRWDHLYIGTFAQNNADTFNRNRQPIGSSHPKSKIPAAALPVIFKMYSQGVSLKEISATFGVTPAAMRLILIGVNRRRETIELRNKFLPKDPVAVDSVPIETK